MPQVDYDKLAAQHGGVDYDAIAKSAGGGLETEESPQIPTQTESKPYTMADYAQMAKDALGGVRAGVASTVFGGGDVIRRNLGMERVIDTPEVKALTTAPESTAGQLGKTAEQVGEFLIPGGMAGRARLAYEFLKGGGLTLAHGGTPTEAAVSGTLGIIPVEKAVSGVAGMFGRSAEKDVVRALTGGGGSLAEKKAARELAPEMIDRWVGGSRPAMLAKASNKVESIGKSLDTAYDVATKAGKTVKGDIIQGNIQLAADALKERNAAGKLVTIPGTEAAVKKLDDLADFVASMGPDIPVDRAWHIRKTWDEIVSNAGLYGPKAQAGATEASHAWAFEKAANSFRSLLNDTNTNIAKLNEEFSFWKRLKDVVESTELKKSSHGVGLGTIIGGSTGAGIGAMSGDTTSERLQGAFIGTVAGRSVLRALQSPTYRTMISAPMKNMLAKALASGSAERVAATLKAVSASLPSQMREEATDGSTWSGLGQPEGQ